MTESHGPSYVSQQWVLRWYGLIPERVYTMTSKCQDSHIFNTFLGNFQ